jgi:hypothetical protein
MVVAGVECPSCAEVHGVGQAIESAEELALYGLYGYERSLLDRPAR